ncbi:ScbR family autoregulator-binding transcription factor [Streptomyces sp. NPDC020141]|uniref:ScbR family autoregulator-binding transcription factor n=1 Tax=Streptomyces sp. NPDC020141 TaxID=3365065 RepID=UPI003795DD26
MTPKQERAVRTRGRLVLSAAEAFDRQGFAVASLTAISRSAGVSNGALHFHFESKEALAVAVETEAAERVRRAAGAPDSAPALQALADAAHAITRQLREDVVVRAGFRLGADASRGSALGLPQQWHRSVVRLVERAHADGSLSRAVPPSDTAAAVAAAVLGFEALARSDPGWLSSGTLAGFWRLLLPRIAADPVESGRLDCEPAEFVGGPGPAPPAVPARGW